MRLDRSALPRPASVPGLRLLVALLAATLSLPAAAQWKWRDKTGIVQYSDVPPPPGIAEADILLRPAPSAPRAAPSASAAASAPLLVPKSGDAELEAKKRKAEQDELAKKRVADERMAQDKLDNCSRARAQAKALDDGQRVARINPKTGERDFLDDKGRAEETQRARAVMASDCK